MSFVSGDPTTSVPITGEAVAVELRLSRFPSRTVGLFLDLLVQIPLLLVVVGLAGWAASGLDSAAGAAIVLVGVVGVLIGYPALVETLSHGRSLGKLAMGMRVVRDDGGPVRFRHSFVRALFMLIDFWLTSGCVGLFSSLASASGKRLGDHVAGTVVVLERVPAAATQLGRVFMPPGLEGWAATLDLRALPDATATQARQFLSRANEFTPEVRASLGQQLAYEVAATVVPYPPAGVPAEVYLAAVIAERTRRAYALAPPPQYPPPTYPSPPAVQVPAYSPPATEVPPTPAPVPSTPGPPAPPDTGFTVPR